MDELLLPLQISFEMSEGRTNGEPCASIFICSEHDLQVFVFEFHQLLRVL